MNKLAIIALCGLAALASAAALSPSVPDTARAGVTLTDDHPASVATLGDVSLFSPLLADASQIEARAFVVISPGTSYDPGQLLLARTREDVLAARRDTVEVTYTAAPALTISAAAPPYRRRE